MAININANTLENKKAILGYDKRIFKGLHFILGYDFAKPYVIVSGDGKFTLNGIKQACKTNNIDTDGIVCILMEKEVDYLKYRQLYLSIIKNNFSKVVVNNHTKYDYKFNYTSSYGMDDFYVIGDFEDTRKTNTKRWFVVIQDEKYKTTVNKEIKVDYSDRLFPVGKFTMWSDFKGNGGFSSGKFRQGNKTHNINSKFGCKNINNPVDKSGYWVPYWKSEQEQKLRAYKSNKRKSEADNYILTSDITKEVEDIKTKLGTLKHTLAEMLLQDKYNIISSVMYKYCYACDGLKRLEERLLDKRYNSISEIRFAIENINEYYDEITNKINVD